MSHFGERGGNEVEGFILLVELLPLLFLLFTEQELFGRVVGLIVAWKLGFHRCDVNDASFLDGSAGPSIIKLLLFLFLF